MKGKKKAATGRRRGQTNIIGGMGYACLIENILDALRHRK